MKIEFPFLWVSRGSKEWGVLLFTIGWVLWALMCAVAIRWDAWKGPAAGGRKRKRHPVQKTSALPDTKVLEKRAKAGTGSMRGN